MARQISELQSIPFYQIIGAPLLAVVQGQTQAAQATAEFIQRVGFEEQEKIDGIGNMRMVVFSYQKPGADGILQTFTAEVPLLSLIPIPSIQVKNADFEFNIKVTDIQNSDTKSVLVTKDAEVGDWLSKGRTEFRATMGKMSASSAEQTVDLQMKVSIKAEQADVTAGMAHLFRVFDQAISSKGSESEEG
ncbi:MAG: DUF2589 domain-containing protein [Vicingaceae bacterium]